MKSEQQIKQHIKGLEQLLFDNNYSDETKKLIMVEIQALNVVLKDD